MSLDRILVVGAHFDDAELGAGGAMAKWSREGRKVFKLTLTDNVTNFTQKSIEVDFESSQSDSAKACEILGAEEVTGISVARCTELAFERRHMQELESFVLDNRIDTVITHFEHDMQQDHVHASTISYVAGRYCPNVLFYQSNRYILPKDFYPRVFVDITDTIELKKAALNAYSSPHDRFRRLFETTIEYNKILGYSAFMQNKTRYAEGFVPLKLQLG